jgi:hypothetical protein
MSAVAEDIGNTLELLLSVKHPTRPSHKLPLPIRRLLPDPESSLDGWQRLTCEDIPAMTAAERAAESFRWKVALAQVEADQVPGYVLKRLALLEAA